MAANRSHSDRSLKVKYEVIHKLEKGASRKDLAQKYTILPNTISTWKNNKNKIFESYEKGPKLEKNQPRGIRNNKQSPHEMVIKFTQ